MAATQGSSVRRGLTTNKRPVVLHINTLRIGPNGHLFDRGLFTVPTAHSRLEAYPSHSQLTVGIVTRLRGRKDGTLALLRAKWLHQ